MKDDLPEEWLPTRKTKGREVPRSEFLAKGPRKEVLSGMMEEWSSVTCEMMERCRSVLMVSLSFPSTSMVLLLISSPEVEDGLGLDQFHVDEHRMKFDRLLKTQLLLGAPNEA